MPDIAVTPGSAVISVRGESLVLRGDRSLLWPRHRWLVVADVHLGKAESLRSDGVALPDSVMEDDLERLRRALSATGAERLLVLGDLVHDARGMTRALQRRVAAWRETFAAEVALVPGNHDRRVAQLPPDWRIDLLPELLSVPPFVFSHEPLVSDRMAQRLIAVERADRAPTSSPFNWHGHLHPVRTIRGGNDRLRLPCFGVGARAGVLPAFSTLAGGSERWAADDASCWVIAGGQVVALPPGR